MQKKQSRGNGLNIADLAKSINNISKVGKAVQPNNLITKNVLLKAHNKAEKVSKIKKDTKDTPVKNTQILSDNGKKSDEYKNLQKPTIYMAFCNWIAQPELTRNPRTQKDFAKEYKVNEDTLTAWKQRPNFWSSVEKNVKSQWKEKTGQAVQALYMNLLRDGGSKEFLAFMSYINGFNPKTVLSDETPMTSKYSEAELALLTDAFKRSGLSAVKEGNKKLLEQFADKVSDDDDLTDL